MKRQRDMKRDLKATGYMESIFAIMVISTSITLLLASISSIDHGDRQADDLGREAEAWKDRVLGLLSVDGTTIEKKDFYLLSSVDWNLRVGEGMRAEIQVLGTELDRIQLVSLGHVPESVEACYSTFAPIIFVDDGPEIMAARLVVVVW
jgi:hypothetical protein